MAFTGILESKSFHREIGHSGHSGGGKLRLFLQSLSDLGRLIDVTQPVLPRSVLHEMPLYIPDQIAHPFAPMIARDFVVQVAEASLNRVSAGAIGGQKQQ